MAIVAILNQNESQGFMSRRLRLSTLLTPQELAKLSDVSQEDVDLFEHNLPLQLGSKLKILKILYARKASGLQYDVQ